MNKISLSLSKNAEQLKDRIFSKDPVVASNGVMQSLVLQVNRWVVLEGNLGM